MLPDYERHRAVAIYPIGSVAAQERQLAKGEHSCHFVISNLTKLEFDSSEPPECHTHLLVKKDEGNGGTCCCSLTPHCHIQPPPSNLSAHAAAAGYTQQWQAIGMLTMQQQTC